jgi:phage-related protein
MAAIDKPLVWLHGEIKSPPLSSAARLETGLLLRKLQRGEKLGMPYSRPMPSIGSRCHELRINDERVTWRIVYRIDTDAIVIWRSSPRRLRRRQNRSSITANDD